MGRVIQVELPDWIDENLLKYVREVIEKRIDEILVDALWNRSLESSGISDDEIEMLCNTIKQSAWEKLKKDLKEKGLVND